MTPPDDQKKRTTARPLNLNARASYVLSDAPIPRVVQPPEDCRQSFAVRGDFSYR